MNHEGDLKGSHDAELGLGGPRAAFDQSLIR